MGAYADYKPPAWKGTCWVCGVPSSSLLIKVGTAENGREVHSTCIGGYIEATNPRPFVSTAPRSSSPEEQAAEADWMRDSFLEIYNAQMNDLQTWDIRPDEVPMDAPVDMNLEGPSLGEPEPEPPAPRDPKKRKMLLDD